MRLREVEEGDLELLLAWAHISQIWRYLPTSRKGESLTWEKHRLWWDRLRNRLDWMIIYQERRVGVLHITGLDSIEPEIGLYIGETTLWGQGVGKRALSLGIEKAKELGIEKLQAMIHPKNCRSVRLFQSLGFKKTGKGRKGQDCYMWEGGK